MKVTYREEVESHRALTKKMRCPNCGSVSYEIHHILEPVEKQNYYLQCADCGVMGYGAPTRDLAIARWKQRTYE